MPEVRVSLYEGLFLLNQQSVSGDFGATVEFVREVFRRAEAEVIVLRKWEERKLAYEIKGQKRGTYLLAYFKARGTQIANIERDCNLSEQVLRCLITRADHIGDVELELAKKDADLSLETKLRARTEEGARPATPGAPGTAPAAGSPEAPKAAAPAGESQPAAAPASA